jgi:hypothetical protein
MASFDGHSVIENQYEYQWSDYQSDITKNVKNGSKKVESGENGLIIVFDKK